MLKNLYYANTEAKGGFWKYYTDLVRNVTVRSVYERFLETGRFDAFKCDWKEGDPNQPHIYWDSDIYKWIEGVAYLTEVNREPELEKIVDGVADLIEKNQRKDGYYNSYFLTIAPDKVFTMRSEHELYCTGHLIEAAIAYKNATGKDKLYNCMLRNVDCIYRIFLEEGSAGFVTPGHEEIELALLKLYGHTGEKKYLELARFFLDNRGNNDREFGYSQDQDDVPIRQLPEALGHAVRANYLYTAMAMMVALENEPEMKEACHRLMDNMLTAKMSITGGVGSNDVGERFSYNYDLPNMSTYNETCAAIALSMFAGEMQQTEVSSRYGDLIERIWFNGFISGLSLSGDKFFYTNPLEIDLRKYDRGEGYQAPCERVKVFSCSCCPPNIVRMLASFARYMYTVDGDTVYCNQFADCETKLTVGGKPATLRQKTAYPSDGKILFEYSGEPLSLFVRVPEWCTEFKGETENGFLKFELNDGESVSVEFPMSIRFIEANPNVRENCGRYAVTRGPIVYCMEGIDNGVNLSDITIIENGSFEVVNEEGIPAPVVYADAERRKEATSLYRAKNDERESFRARLIPYFAFANREKSDMLVWTMVK